MKRVLISAVLATSALLLCSAVGQAGAKTQTWTLEECVKYALDNNIIVKQGEINVAQSEIALNTAQNSRLPGVSARASQNLSYGRGLTEDNTYDNSNTTNTGVDLGAELVLFRGFYIKNNIAENKLNLAAATADLAKAKDDIKVAVAKAYVQILYNTQILEVAKSQVVIDSLQVERLQVMVQSGKAASVELAQQEASLAQSQFQKTKAESSLSLAVLELTQLLELPFPDGFEVAKPQEYQLQARLIDDPENIYAQAVGFKPSIKAEQSRLEAAQSRIQLAKSSLYPTLSLSAGLGSNYYTSSNRTFASFADQMNNNFSQYVGISLNVPIFARYSTRNNIRSAQLHYDNQKLQLDNAKKTIYKEIQNVYYNTLTAQDKLSGAEKVAASTKTSFELVQAKYEAGKASITEFNEAKNNLVKAESDLAQACYEHLYQYCLIEYYKTGEVRF